MPKSEPFDDLVENAFDFIERAMQQLDEDPKYAVINFCAGIELFLKARLLCEHWSLVFVDPAKANIENFNKGEFESVGFRSAIQRLKSIGGIRISPQAINSFDAVRSHRNQLMHFFNSAYSQPLTVEAQANIAVEQCAAWHHMYRLITKQFGDEFLGHQDRTESLQNAIARKHPFLLFLYQQRKPEIEKAKNRGKTILKCWSCKFDASIRKETAKCLFLDHCLVCNFAVNTFGHACDCGGVAQIIDCGGGNCEACGQEFKLNDLLEEYDESGNVYRDGIYCSECEGPNVVPWEDKWLCLHCIILHQNIQQCDWCTEMVTGEHEFSSIFGCFMCPGSDAFHRD